jgi:hypothetical protein
VNIVAMRVMGLSDMGLNMKIIFLLFSEESQGASEINPE